MKDEWIKKYSEVDDMLDMADLVEDIESETKSSAAIQEGVLGGQTTQAGIQAQDLHSVISGWADALNRAAIAKSTGKPVRTPVAQYKGFAAEEFFKQTMKINALAKGVPNYKIGIYTNGELPDGTILSGIDMYSDIVVFSRKWPWQRAMKIADAQSKIHKGPNAGKAYAKDMAKEQYANQEFVGGSGLNDIRQIAGSITSHVAGTAISAKVAATTGASIGSALGPIGTVVGAAVGGMYNSILSYCQKRNSVNAELNRILNELMDDQEDSGFISPFIDEIIRFMEEVVLLIDKQYISFDEAMYIVCGERLYE